jgi:L-rhamnose mutarotase
MMLHKEVLKKSKYIFVKNIFFFSKNLSDYGIFKRSMAETERPKKWFKFMISMAPHGCNLHAGCSGQQ